MEYRECRTCEEYLPIEKFYTYPNETTGKLRLGSPDCKECDKEKARNKRKEHISETGSEAVLTLPNTYKDQMQKKQTFDFLTLLGWKYNEQNGIWYDDIKKTKYGQCIGVWTPTEEKKRLRLVFTSNNPPVMEVKKSTNNRLSEEKINNILYDYYVDNMSCKKIAKKYSVDIGTATKYTKAFYNIEMDRRRSTVVHKNKTSNTRKKHLNKDVPKVIPVVKMNNKPMFTAELIRDIQNDYFYGDLKFFEVVDKYKEFEAKTVAYIIRKTMTLIKTRNDADKKKYKDS